MSTPAEPRILILGPGAVGGYFGARLLAAGAPVAFAARGASARALRERGLVLESEVHGRARYPVRVLEAPDGERFDLILVAVKNPHLPQAATLWREALAGEGAVLSLLNGVTAPEVLAAVFPRPRVVPGLCYVGAERVAPGVVRHRTAGRIELGPLFPEQAPAAERAHRWLTGYGLPVRYRQDIWDALWEKLLWNAALNPTTALADRTIGDLLESEAGRLLVRRAMEETLAVARAEGAGLEAADLDRAIEQARGWKTITTSMWQDRRAGRPLELEALVGEVVRRGRRRGVPTPVLETLYQLLKVSSGQR